VRIFFLCAKQAGLTRMKEGDCQSVIAVEFDKE